jgi:hypothetical protein
MNQSPKKASKPGAVHLRIIEVLKQFPEGASGGQIRQELEKEGLKPEEQTHLDRRKRDLKKWFVIQKIKISQVVAEKQRNVTLYNYVGLRKAITDEGQIDSKTRAHVIRVAHGRRQMCEDSLHPYFCVVDICSNLSRRDLISASAKA